MVDGIYLDQPQRQVVAVDEIFIGAIEQRLERMRQEGATEEARVRMNREREQRQQGEEVEIIRKSSKARGNRRTGRGLLPPYPPSLKGRMPRGRRQSAQPEKEKSGRST